MTLIILDEAKIEINEHVAWYRDRDAEAAVRLSAMFQQAVVEIARQPLQYSLMEMRRNPGNLRRVLLKGFPIYIPTRYATIRFMSSPSHTPLDDRVIGAAD